MIALLTTHAYGCMSCGFVCLVADAYVTYKTLTEGTTDMSDTRTALDAFFEVNDAWQNAPMPQLLTDEDLAAIDDTIDAFADDDNVTLVIPFDDGLGFDWPGIDTFDTIDPAF